LPSPIHTEGNGGHMISKHTIILFSSSIHPPKQFPVLALQKSKIFDEGMGEALPNLILHISYNPSFVN